MGADEVLGFIKRLIAHNARIISAKDDETKVPIIFNVCR
jgi:hypothetical protein